MIDVEFDLSLVNKAYLPYLDDTRFFQIFKGGGSAGKSVFISQKIILKMMELKNYNGLVVRKHSADNNDSTFAELCKTIEAWEVGRLFKINKSKGGESITCINGSKCIFKGLDDPEKRKGTTFSTGPLIWVWIEEATEIAESDLNQLIIRLRGTADIPKHIYISFNPIDIDHWLKARFFDTPLKPEDGYICETTYKDNAYLTAVDIKHLEAWEHIDNYYYMVYCLNQWGSINTARVFTDIIVEDFTYKPEDLQNDNHGMDFGYNHANTLMSLGFKDGEVYIFGEHYYKKHTNKQFIDKVNAHGFNKRLLITADSAEPALIKEWCEAGYNVHGAKKGPDSLMRGINYLKNLKIHIHATNCPNAAREFTRFKYRELKDGTITDQVVEIDDDTIAGCRYAVEHLITGFTAMAYDANGKRII